jgi:tripartite-type tricarboxylate transporter receptor subunit TctC
MQLRRTHQSRLRLKSVRILACLFPAVLLLAAAGAQAAGYPERPVNVILPFAAGTVTDTVTRIVTGRLSQRLGQSFIVINRPGAYGAIGAQQVARAIPDGYTILFTTNTTHSVINSLMKKVPYDPQRDFTPVAKLAGLASMVIVGPALNVNSIAELVARAKAKPNTVRYGFGNSSGQIGGANLRRAAGAQMLAIPYKSTPQAVQDLLGGQLEVIVVDIPTGLIALQTGKARALAVLTEKRVDLLPNVPTLNEALGPGNDALAWFGVFGPAGMPAEAVKVLASEMKAVMGEPAVEARLKSIGVVPGYLPPASFTPFLASELVRWTKLAHNAGITPDSQ